VPFTDGPDLPELRTVVSRIAGQKQAEREPFEDRVLEWWQSVSSMPHCILWKGSDWQFAIATAHVAAEAFAGRVSAMTELRYREKIMGTTVDARLSMKLRYIHPDDAARREKVRAVPALDDFRDL